LVYQKFKIAVFTKNQKYLSKI